MNGRVGRVRQTVLNRLLPAKAPDTSEQLQPRWATVKQLSPLRVQLDGDANPLPVDPVNLDPRALTLEMRVWCLLFKRQLFVISHTT